ncbi:MAG: hypothetical protein AABW72_00945 [archaeon]
MATKQINLKLQENLYEVAESFAHNYGFRNIQDLVYESLREKLFEHNAFDENFSDKQIELIDDLIVKSIKSKKIVAEKQLLKALK